MYFQVLNKTVTEIRWPKLASLFEYHWEIGIVVKLSFSINNGTEYLVLLKCLWAELTAKIIRPHPSLLPPLTPAWKLVFDSSVICGSFHLLCGIEIVSSSLPAASWGSFSWVLSFPLICFLSCRALLRMCELISEVHDTKMNFISLLSSQKATAFYSSFLRTADLVSNVECTGKWNFFFFFREN